MRRVRITLVLVTTVLLSLGTVMIYSASAVYAYERYGDMGFFLKKHLASMILGLAGALLAMIVDYRILRRYSRVLLLIAILLLVLVLVPGIGRSVGGARRWFRFPPVQPSEFAKLALIFYLADYLARQQEKIRVFRYGLVTPLLVLGACAGLVVIQPDLGSAVLMAAVTSIMLFIAGANIVHLAGFVLLSIPVLWVFIAGAEYRRRRILAFLNPWKDPGGVGFQIIQSFIALGSGGIFGRGLGQSRQKLFYLPASHTDFIFSIIGEELGLVGVCLVVFLFILFVWQGAKIALKAGDLFGQLLAAGMVALIGLEAAINISVSTGVFPTKGLPLPFLSYGGSALVSNLIAVGVLLNVGRARADE